MASVKAIIDINESGIGKLSKIVTNQYTNNVSKHPHTNEIVVSSYSLTDMEKNDGAQVYPFNLVTFSQYPRYYSDELYNGYMYGVTDENGLYNLELTIYGSNLFKLGFYFDKTSRQYPLHYEVTYLDGSVASFEVNEENENFDPVNLSIVIIFQSGLDTSIPQKVLFNKWAKPNYNVSIVYIESYSAKLEMSSAWITNISSSSELTSNGDDINYGCLANTGSIDMIDIDKTLFMYAQYGYLDINAFNISLFFNNKEFQFHIPNDSPYFSEDDNFEVSLTNNISFWDNIQCNDLVYDGEIDLFSVLNDLIAENIGASYSEVYEMVNGEMNTGTPGEDITILKHLKSIIVPPFTLKSDSLRNNIDKICTVAQLYCIEDDNGKIKFYSARPLVTQNQIKNILVLDSTLLIEKPVSSILVTNRYDGVIIE